MLRNGKGVKRIQLRDRIQERRRNGPSLKILFILTKDPAVGRHMDSLRRALMLQGHQLLAVSPGRHPGLISDEGTGELTRRVVSLGAVAGILAEFKPDIVLVPLSSHGVDADSRKWCDRSGTLLVSVDPLGSKPGPEGRYHVFSNPADEEHAPDGIGSLLPGADASMFSDGEERRRQAGTLFGVSDAELLLQHYPDLYRGLNDAGDTLLSSTAPGPTAGADAAVWIHPPQKRLKKAAAWTVMESLSSGALVLLPQEAARGYSHLPGVLAYRGTDGLEARMVEIRQGRFDVERAAQESREALIRDYLYEDQFDRLFEQVAALASLGQLPASVASRFLDRWSLNPQPAGRVVGISGWYGERNVGDELILTSLVQGIRRVSPSTQVVVASPKPSRVEADHGLAAYPRHEARAMAQMAEYADCLLVGGGGIWNDKAAARNGGLAGLFSSPRHSVVNLATLPVMFQALGKPVAGVGLGVGPLNDPSGRALVRLMASLCSVLSVRDEVSKNTLADLGGPMPEVQVASDLAFAIRFEPREPRQAAPTPGKLRLAVNVRAADTAAGPAPVGFWPGLTAALADLANDGDCEIVGIPCHVDDEGELRRLFDSAGLQSSVVLPFVVDASQLAADLSTVDVMVSMRLHASILSHRMRVPVVGLNYEEKVGGYFHEMGQADRLMDRSDRPEDLYRVIRETMDGRPALVRELSNRAGDLETDAREALDATLRTIMAKTVGASFDFLPVPQ